jgi:SAM-dependent methyltransferase
MHPLRAVGRRARRLRSGGTQRASGNETRHDLWLELFDEILGPIDEACADGRPESYALFRDLDDDLWALLLTQEYGAYPNIRSLLPKVPDRSLQELWNGASDVTLAAQSKAFYTKLRERYAAHSELALTDSRVLDFGCGWGRLTRYLARDVEPGQLYGCDPADLILEVCRDSGVPATLARSEFRPEQLPFAGPFDLVFSFSVFTHVSEPAHASCLSAIHEALRPGGLLVLTIRPPEYLLFSELMQPALESLGGDYEAQLQQPLYLFVPHPAEPSHLQYTGGEMTYGEAVITLAYVKERWAPMFELLEVDILIGDLYQVVLALRRQ